MEEAEDAKAYVVVLEGGLTGVLLADEEYPGKVAIRILHELLVVFQQNVPKMVYAGIKQDIDVKFQDMDIMIKKYQDPKEADKILKLESELEDVQKMLTKTLGDVRLAV